jgi:hypothetical protein
VVFLAGKQAVSIGEELQRKRACGFFVLRATAETVGFFPYRRLDNLEWDFAARENGLKRTTCPTVLESARGALLGHRLGALNSGAIGVVCLNPGAQREHVDAFLGTGADGWNVGCIDESRRGAVRNLHNSEPTVNTGIDAEDSAEDSHGVPPNRFSCN